MPGHTLADDRLLTEFIADARLGQAPPALNSLIEKFSAGSADARRWQQFAARMMADGWAGPAVEFLSAAIARFPQDPELRCLRGNAHRLAGRSAEAEREFRAILDRFPSHREAALSLAFMLREQGRLNAAAGVIAELWNAGKRDPAQTIEYLSFLRECGMHQRAHALARSALALWPHDAALVAAAAEFALAIGEFDATRQYLHHALDLAPGDGMSWLRLAYCQRFADRAEPDFRRLESGWKHQAANGDLRTHIGFAFGKALDDIGDYAAASEVLCAVNASKAERSAWSDASWQEFVRGQLAQSALPQVNALADFVPVFVIGLPRTGTTLVASLLARDPRLRDRGELNWIDGMYQLLASQGRLHDVRAISRVSEIVSAQMRQDDAPASWYLDKNPLNFRHLNLIAAMFPNAKIIHCRRDRRDTALSLWMQHFAHGDLNFSYEFSRIAAFESGYQRLVRHWRDALPLDFLDVDYESLVTDTSSSVDRMREFLGMLSPEMPVPHAASSAVTTASVWQVRQPVYTSSIGRWKNYEGHLPQLRRLF